jgi:hypothetical protein
VLSVGPKERLAEWVENSLLHSPDVRADNERHFGKEKRKKEAANLLASQEASGWSTSLEDLSINLASLSGWHHTQEEGLA